MKKKISILIAFLAITFTSCVDNILDREPLDIISDAQVFKDQTLADAKLTLAYTKMTVMLNECPRIRNPKETATWYIETDNGSWVHLTIHGARCAGCVPACERVRCVSCVCLSLFPMPLGLSP